MSETPQERAQAWCEEHAEHKSVPGTKFVSGRLLCSRDDVVKMLQPLEAEVEQFRDDRNKLADEVVYQRARADKAEAEVARLTRERETCHRTHQPQQHIRAIQRAQEAEARLARVVEPLERFRPLSDMNRSDPNPYWVAIREALAATRDRPTDPRGVEPSDEERAARKRDHVLARVALRGEGEK